MILTTWQIKTLHDIYCTDDEDYKTSPTEISIENGAGHNGIGDYAYLSEYPEEGSIFLDQKEQINDQ